jgi:hypothetical protein
LDQWVLFHLEFQEYLEFLYPQSPLSVLVNLAVPEALAHLSVHWVQQPLADPVVPENLLVLAALVFQQCQVPLESLDYQ